MSNVVPFGKYKGQPVEAMAQDEQYVQWLLGQDWFQSRYQNIHAVIINNFQEPAETPEHNALQMRFLEEEFRFRFAYAVIGDGMFDSWKPKTIQEKVEEILQAYKEHRDEKEGMLNKKRDYAKRYLESENLTPSGVASWNDDIRRAESGLEELEGNYSKAVASVGLEGCGSNGTVSISNPRFEVGGVDVCFIVLCGIRINFDRDFISRDTELSAPLYGRYAFAVEIKPTLGDDFPAVLRQMKHSGAQQLLISDYSGQGATREQLVAFFRNEGIAVVWVDEVENITPPDYPKTVDEVVKAMKSL
jgi:hypothetical protein